MSTLKDLNTTGRFSSKVADYVAYRPSYPEEVFTTLKDRFPELLNPGAVIVDVGSGTGILTLQLLNAFPQATVYAVEPNEPMRKAAEEYIPASLANSGRFVSVNGTAEDTTLPDNKADLMTAGTAAHWFHVEATKKEWQRVLKPDGGAAFAWNSRRTSAFNLPFKKEQSEVMQLYDELTSQFRDLEKHRSEVLARIMTDLNEFFSKDGFKTKAMANSEWLTLDQLIGRLTSSSSAPARDTSEYQVIVEKLTDAFERSKDEDGKVEYDYQTVLILGRMKT